MLIWKRQANVSRPMSRAFSQLCSRRAAWLAANVAALAAVLAIVTGPSMSHHYAESLPFHAHVYADSGLAADHEHAAESHSHAGENGEVVSVSDHASASSSMMQVMAAFYYDTTPQLISYAELTPAQQGNPQRSVKPPEQPPRIS